MRRKQNLFAVLLMAIFVPLASCATQPTVNGLWQDTEKAGTIEFKGNGEVIIVDNMSATVIGYFKVKDDNSLELELVASNILSESVQPGTRSSVSARIIKLTDDELEIEVVGEDGIETYKRIR